MTFLEPKKEGSCCFNSSLKHGVNYNKMVFLRGNNPVPNAVSQRAQNGVPLSQKFNSKVTFLKKLKKSGFLVEF